MLRSRPADNHHHLHLKTSLVVALLLKKIKKLYIKPAMVAWLVERLPHKKCHLPAVVGIPLEGVYLIKILNKIELWTAMYATELFGSKYLVESGDKPR